MSFRKRHPHLAKLTLATLDGLGFGAAYLFAAAVTLPAGWRLLEYAAADIHTLAAALAVWYVVAFRQRLFFTRRGELLLHQLFSTTRVLFTWLILSVFLAAMIAPHRVDQATLLVFAGTSIVLVLFGRAFLRFSVWDLRRRGYNAHRILIVGANRCTERFVATIRSNDQFGWRIEGFLDDDPAMRAYLERHGIPYLGTIPELERLLVQRVIDGVYVNLPLRTSYNTVQNIVSLCEGVGVPVRMVAELFPLRTGWTDVRRISGIPVVSLVSRPSTHLRNALNRAIEWLTASVLLALLSPILLTVAAAIGLTSGRPVLVKRVRLSTDSKPFQMLAFRTARLRPENPLYGLTRLGRVLRRYGLEDLPQLINVWRGEISLVDAGPLPLSQAHPSAGWPPRWPERVPGVVRLWEQFGEDLHPRMPARRQQPTPAEPIASSVGDFKSTVAGPSYKGSD